MCDFVSKKYCKEPRKTLLDWIYDVQKYLKKKQITFQYEAMGSAKRNMVIRKCNEDYFDLDYRLILQNVPEELENECKELKNLFRNAFDNNKPDGFKNCEDSTQSLTIKNDESTYGYDITIFKKKKGKMYILYNKKNTNDANNNDYQWEVRSDMSKYHERYKKIKGSDMWNYLRNTYKEKRHDHKDDQEPKKAAYQLFNEAVVDTLKHFNVDYN